jgi:hypothetical protein
MVLTVIYKVYGDWRLIWSSSIEDYNTAQLCVILHSARYVFITGRFDELASSLFHCMRRRVGYPNWLSKAGRPIRFTLKLWKINKLS